MRHRMLLVWTLGFAGGIIAQSARSSWLLVWLGLGLAGLALLLLAGPRWAILSLGILLMGWSAGALRQAVSQTVPATDISRYASRDGPAKITGSVVSEPEQRHGGRLTFFLRAETIRQGANSSEVTGFAYVTLAQAALSGFPPPDYGSRLTLIGVLEAPVGATNPGAFSWRDYLARRCIWCELNVKRAGGYNASGSSALNPLLRVAWAIRRHILAALTAVLPATQAAVLAGILLGQRSALPPTLMADFVHTGTVHILASAGLHVGVVAFWAICLFERLTLPRKLSALLTICTLILFSVMAGGRPSVTRAALMAALYFGAMLFEREPDLPTTLAAAALYILLLQPTALFEAGFQMSFLTVLTLAVAMPVWQSWWERILEKFALPRLPRKALWWILEMLGLSLLAQIGSLPIVALDYNEVSLSGFLANALVVPTLFLVIPLGFAGAGAWAIWPAAGAWALRLAGFGLSYIAYEVQFFGSGASAYRAVVSPAWWVIALYYGAIYGLFTLLTPPSAPVENRQEKRP